MSDAVELRSAVEALLFISGTGLTAREIASGLSADLVEIQIALDSLVDDYLERNGGIVISEGGGVYRFTTRGSVFPYIQNFLKEKKKETLSRTMMEVLAIITYKQPVTLYEIDEIRGTSSRSQVTSLVSRNLIKVVGQKEVPGRPSLYGTTRAFLEYFNLNSLEELPPPEEVKALNFEEL